MNRYHVTSLMLPYQKTFLILLLCILSAPFAALAQEEDDDEVRTGSRIIDDTTRQIYGPTTSRYFYEEEVFFNQGVLYPIDTVIRNFHRFTPIQKTLYTYQDLGNIATAAHPIFYQVPEEIGVTSGFNAYDLYWDAKKIRYFDTKSPYVNLKLSLGGRGRSMTNVTYSRNINPRWNFGFDYRGMFIDKQVQRVGKGDRHVRSTYYDFFTTYQSKDSAYRVFFNFARNHHAVDEYGGVLVDPDAYSYEQFFLVNARPNLVDAESREIRIRMHLYHQYEFAKGLQVYHVFDRYRQGNQFFDNPRTANTDIYDYNELDSTLTHDQTRFRVVRNEAGIKGSLLKLFYNGYYAIRYFDMDYKYLPDGALQFVEPNGTEHYLGGRLALQLDSLVQLRGWAEVNNNGQFRIEGLLQSKWLEASLKQNKYRPGFVTRAYRGQHDYWENSFADVNVTQLSGFARYRSRIFTLSPGITFTRVQDYVFFDYEPPIGDEEQQTVLPVQSTGSQVMFAPEVRFSLTFFKNFTLSGRGIYSILAENDANAFRVPDVFANAQLSYANIFFNGNFDIHFGLDVHYRSAYNALGYDPVIQQFYTQDRFQVPDFPPVVDFFFNAKIKRGRIFVKWHNFVQMFSNYGYFPTPYYPGQRSIVDFGFDWSFYD